VGIKASFLKMNKENRFFVHYISGRPTPHFSIVTSGGYHFCSIANSDTTQSRKNKDAWSAEIIWSKQWLQQPVREQIKRHKRRTNCN
jgi:hypothetical protein